MIDITGVDLVRFVKEVYALSVSQGMGFLHARPGNMSNEDVVALVNREKTPDVALDLDYVQGRACKMTVFRNGDRLEIDDKWFDHTDAELAELLRRFGISREQTP